MAQRRMVDPSMAPDIQDQSGGSGGGPMPGGAPPIMRTPPPAPPPPVPGELMGGGEPERDPVAQSGETPRERASTVAPRRPDMPSPANNSAGGVLPFQPMMGSSEVGISSPAQQGLFGGAGGLTGGGLGVPLDPHTNQQSPDIAGLLKMLQQGMGGR